MASPLVTTLNQISTDWEAATPPDRTAVVYHEVDGRRRLLGDRTFYFDLPTRLEPTQQYGVATTTVRWSVPVVLRIAQTGKSQQALVDAVANEGTLLARTIETRETWPAGVIDVLTEDVTPEREEDDGDAILTFNVIVECGETD